MRPSLPFSRRVYAALLLLYPAALRRQFGEEMIEVFTDQMRDACRKEGWIGGMGVWRCVGGEALRDAASRHLQTVAVSLVSSLAALGFLCSFFWAVFAHH